MKYNITRTIIVYKSGEREILNNNVVVEDIEEYRRKLMKPKYAYINFVYGNN